MDLHINLENLSIMGQLQMHQNPVAISCGQVEALSIVLLGTLAFKFFQNQTVQRLSSDPDSTLNLRVQKLLLGGVEKPRDLKHVTPCWALFSLVQVELIRHRF